MTKNKIRPHKIKHYLANRDPDFDAKMEQVLDVYREVKVLKYKEREGYSAVSLSYDETGYSDHIDHRP